MGQVIISPEWVQAIAAVLTLAAIAILGVTTYRVQRKMAEREEASNAREAAWNVRPDLTYKTERIGPSQHDPEDTAWMSVTNIGNGPAYDVELSVQLPTWHGRSRSIDPFDKLLVGSPEVFDTWIKITDLRHESGDTFKLVIWGTMKDGDGREIPIRKERVSYKDKLDSHEK